MPIEFHIVYRFNVLADKQIVAPSPIGSLHPLCVTHNAEDRVACSASGLKGDSEGLVSGLAGNEMPKCHNR